MLCWNDSVLLSPQSQNEEAILAALALSCNSAQFLSCWSALLLPFLTLKQLQVNLLAIQAGWIMLSVEHVRFTMILCTLMGQSKENVILFLFSYNYDQQQS
jgi:hypothetical protein